MPDIKPVREELHGCLHLLCHQEIPHGLGHPAATQPGGSLAVGEGQEILSLGFPCSHTVWRTARVWGAGKSSFWGFPAPAQPREVLEFGGGAGKSFF